ncbi:MAG TPA: YHS domain-containing (seleno)protein [Myxococcota bacterium]|nr:YHS domain-containing (seleno)protein [Myxococcota bacterium]
MTVRIRLVSALRDVILLGVVLAAAALAHPAHAQLESRPALTLAAARAAVSAALAEARRLETTGAVAVVDATGFVLALERLDGTFPVSAEISVGKARTAAVFGKPTREFEEIVRNGRTPMLALADRVGFVPLQGGVPILVQGRIAGAIGVSGAASAQQDEELALVGARAVTAPTPAPAAAPGPPFADPPDFWRIRAGASSNEIDGGPSGPRTAVSATGKQLVNVNAEGVALEGHDPVGFHAQRRPVKGHPRWSSRFGGATYWFASAESKAAFDADPARYEPAFGGYCGYAASIQRISPVDVRFFQILDGRLVLQHNQKALDLWSQDVRGNLAKADAHWPGLLERNGSAPIRLVNVDARGVAIAGYDVMAYQLEGRARRGDPAIESMYGGARYHFASQEHRARFESEPARWVPAYGGFSGYAASIGRVSPVDPAVFQVHDGRLILQHTEEARRRFNEDLAGSVASADRNWPELVAQHGSAEGPGLTKRLARLLGLPI